MQAFQLVEPLTLISGSQALRPRSRRTLAKMKRGLSEEAPRCRRGFGILNALVQAVFAYFGCPAK
jgi:hypothetical protein